MKITKVCCQGCGAKLEVNESVRYVTCNYCDAQLEVIHDETVTHTKRLENIEQATRHISRKVEVLELQNDIEHLDRQWDKFRESVSHKDDKGNILEPNAGIALAGGVIGIAAGGLLSAFSCGGPFVEGIVGGVVIVLVA